jgi:tRNA 2-thiouridine synthesizing protein D
MRLLDIAARRGHNLNVFAYEGAVSLAFAKQAPHANSVHGRSVDEEDHPNPKEWVAAIIAEAGRHGGKVEWVQCGLCVDERGAGECIPGLRRGSPADLLAFAEASHNTLVVPTR